MKKIEPSITRFSYHPATTYRMSVVLYCPYIAWRNGLFMFIEKNEEIIPFAFIVALLIHICLILLCELRRRPAEQPPGRTIEQIKAERLHVQNAILALEQHTQKLDTELGMLSSGAAQRPAKRMRSVAL